MKPDRIKSLIGSFEDCSNKTEDGLEFWFARDVQHLLGYNKWENFVNVISRAKTVCEISGAECQDHFPDIKKKVSLGSGAQKLIDDFCLTRYACYLIAQNGDSSKEQVAFAQTYFAYQTRRAEIIEQKILESERVQVRRKLTETEKELSSVIYQQTSGSSNDFALIRSRGDSAFFGGKSTGDMKIIWKTDGKPVADFMPTILLKAKDFATEITIHNAREKSFESSEDIRNEHITNNQSVRQTLISRGIIPERMRPLEDVKKVEKRLESEKKVIEKELSEEPVDLELE